MKQSNNEGDRVPTIISTFSLVPKRSFQSQIGLYQIELLVKGVPQESPNNPSSAKTISCSLPLKIIPMELTEHGNVKLAPT